MPRGRHVASRPVQARPGRLAAAVLAGILLIGSAGTWAYWTDSATVTGGTLASGSMDLQVDGGAVGTGTDITISSISTSDLTPGEFQAFGLTLGNVGTPDFTWTAEVTRGTTWTYVDDALTVQLFAGVPVDDATYPRQDTCSGASLGDAVAVTAGVTNPVTAAQALASGATVSICLRVGMTPTAGNGNQGKAGSLAVTFEALQVTG